MPNTHRQPPPVDTLLVGSLRLNAERSGRCAQCRTLTTARRAVRTTYLPPSLNRREQAHLTRGDLSDAQVTDRYLQRIARRQLRGDLGDEQVMALCASCATRWLLDCLEHGPGVLPDPDAPADASAEAKRGALALVAGALKRQTPLFAAVVWRIERGPDGRSQASAVIHSSGPIAPQVLIRAQSDLRRHAREYGRAIFA